MCVCVCVCVCRHSVISGTGREILYHCTTWRRCINLIKQRRRVPWGRPPLGRGCVNLVRQRGRAPQGRSLYMIIITKANEKQRLKSKKQIHHGVRIGSSLQYFPLSLSLQQSWKKEGDKCSICFIRWIFWGVFAAIRARCQCSRCWDLSSSFLFG